MLSNSISTYLKLGVSYAQLEDSLSTPVGFIPTITNYHSNKNAFGFTAGLGIAKSLTDHTAIFTEADYHDYGTVDFSNFQNLSATYTHSSHVYSYDAAVGATYSF